MKHVLLTLGFISLAALGYAAYNTLASEGEELILEVGANAMYIADQPTTNTVVATYVSPDSPSFIVVSTYENGAAGTQLGASNLITAGSHSDVTIPLSRTTIDGEMLIAQLYKDNGDGALTADDQLLRDAAGDTIYGIFLAQNDIALPVLIDVIGETAPSETPQSAVEIPGDIAPESPAPEEPMTEEPTPTETPTEGEVVVPTEPSEQTPGTAPTPEPVAEPTTEAPEIGEPSAETPSEATTEPAPETSPTEPEIITPTEPETAPDAN